MRDITTVNILKIEEMYNASTKLKELGRGVQHSELRTQYPESKYAWTRVINTETLVQMYQSRESLTEIQKRALATEIRRRLNDKIVTIQSDELFSKNRKTKNRIIEEYSALLEFTKTLMNEVDTVNNN